VLFRASVLNQIFFCAKRVFHGALRVLRKPLQSVAPGLTAARFDMLYALAHRTYDARRFKEGEMSQSDLRRKLGVSAPVVSRMLRSLEELGWVKRERLKERYQDRRQCRVRLTAAGVACVREAYGLLFRAVERIVTRAICFGGRRHRVEWFPATDTVESYLRSLREYCKDTATLYYRWGHPDD
jgi:DNA-binding MarR family transcriptional regulator